jgi:hypothetical protein
MIIFDELARMIVSFRFFMVDLDGGAMISFKRFDEIQQLRHERQYRHQGDKHSQTGENSEINRRNKI